MPQGGLRSPTVWDRSAKKYDGFEKRWHYYEAVAEGMLRELSLPRGAGILELACGTGACTRLLASRVDGLVTAIDWSAGMLEQAARNLASAGISNVSLVQGGVGDLRTLTPTGRMFDIAVCNSAFWHFPGPRRVLGDLLSLLRPGGVLAFNLPFWFRRDGDSAGLRAAVDRILSEHGVDPADFRGNWTQTDYPRVARLAGFEVVKDVHYSVPMRKGERETWRSIPAFSRRQGPGPYGNLPEGAAEEVRKEVEAWRASGRQGGPTESRWRAIVARSP